MKPFGLYEPTTVDETVALLGQLGDKAKLYAGGTELLLTMKSGLLHYDGLVNVKTVPQLAVLEASEELLTIGAAVSHASVESDSGVIRYFPLLARVEHGVANVRVRNVGTLAGNLCFADPHSDVGALLLLYEAEFAASGGSGTITASLESLISGPYETSLAQDDVLTSLKIPCFPPDMKGAYLKFGYHHRPTVGVGAAVSVKEGIFESVRITMGSISPKPLRLRDAEARLVGRSVDDYAAIEEAGDIAAVASDAIDDLHGSADYKKHIAKIYVGRALRVAIERGER